MIRIAVDAMGGDHAPEAIIAGALMAARRLQISLLLVGARDVIRAELRRHPGAASIDLQILDAPERVEMEEAASVALRRKPNASIRLAAAAVRDGEAAALFSAGHTGATVMAAHSAFGRLPGVDRPALATTIPTRLLSVGEEESKGNELTREAHQLLKSAPVNFVGNVEGRDVYSGEADVIVCDGFTGNITLKISEGLVETVERLLLDELSSTVGTRVGYLLSRQAFLRFRKRVDYSEYGGAPLIGVDGLCVVGHGRSSAKAVRSALAMTVKCVQDGLLDRLAHEVVTIR
jgi:glycerol-3-phosphate acyltransferase PlsX